MWLAERELTPDEIEEVVEMLAAPEETDDLKADFLRRLRARGETAAEIAGFAEALLRRAVDPGLSPVTLAGPLIDVCGTGGDRCDLFNVSTTSMFVVAAAGATVAKHGNRAVTSQSGGADVLEALGIRIDLPPAEFRRCLAETGLGFLFAPLYHPAFKAIGPVRKRLAAEGVATIFNLLGPLLNPARPPRQIVGLFSEPLLPLYGDALAHLGREKAWVVHGAGLDELTTTGVNQVEERASGASRRFTLDPRDYGFAPAHIAELRGGDRTLNAALLEGILSGEIRGPKREMVELNSGAALYVAGVAADLPEAFARAREALASGAALARLRALQSFTARAGE